MVLGCNHLPGLPPDDEGTWRRVRVVEFKSRFIDNPDPTNRYEFKRDYHLTEKLYMWKETFMYILLEHYKHYKKNSIHEPAAVMESTAEYQRTNDMYRDFINDCLIKDEKGAAKLEEVFNYFKVWWKDNYSGKTPSRKDMKACIEKKVGKYQTNSHGGGWKGWTLVIPVSKGQACALADDDDDDETGEVVVASGQIEG
jgi:phage/plasmid-associated DNA primase